ncbi:MAG TPA: outer membrane beta-barrel protein [Vicinamibacterales bacterium]|nr:outer membrane beta-barrel protein [Vicinamibacterales bacterium]
MILVPARGRILVLAVLFLCCQVAEARADFFITPFLGSEFAGSTTLLDLDTGAASSKHWTFGGSAAWLSDGILGVEADFSIVPGFFQNSSGTGLVIGSRVTTLTGSVIVALPLSVTRESLRPYAVGGLGLLHASSEDILSLNESGDWLGLQIGAGAIGLITNRAGVRFDLRHLRALSRDTTLRGEQTSKLSFWRATVGVTLRY